MRPRLVPAETRRDTLAAYIESNLAFMRDRPAHIRALVEIIGGTRGTGNPRTLLVRDSWIWMLVGVAGVWLLASVVYGRPALMVVFRSFVLTKVGPEGPRGWEARWDHDAGFRQGLRTLTAVWGAATILNAVLHVIGAFVLPLDTAPLVLNLVWPVIAVPLPAFHLVYTRRKDLRA
ncbi:VC0807 family protein [Spirillospora sp. CA-108201]